MTDEEIFELAARHGLRLEGELRFNEMGIDFRVAFARDADGAEWVLRIPRRGDLAEQIERERRILELAKQHLSVAVPDWRVAAPDLIAYPLLPDPPVLTFDAVTYEVTWNIDRDDNRYTESLARVLCDLHRVPASDAAGAGLAVADADTVRRELLADIDRVKRELGVSAELETRWRGWIDRDEYWPQHSTFVHGDLYAGHVLADAKGNISGIIDWSEARVSDPSIDFAGHLAAFGEESLRELIGLYAKCGGRTWGKMFEQARERHAASPLKYGVFAIETGSGEHIAAARAQLGVA